MEENKDLNLTENEAENTAAENSEAEYTSQTKESEAPAQAEPETEQDSVNSADDSENTAEDSEGTAYQDGFSFPDELENIEPAPASSKKKLIMPTIIISAAIVAAFACVVLVTQLFFNTSVNGSWKAVRTLMSQAATSDEPETLEVEYTFDFKGDKTVCATIGSVTSTGSYEVFKNDDGDQIISITLTDAITTSGYVDGEYKYSVSGNAFTGRELTLTSTSNEEDVITLAGGSYSAPALEREGDFAPNDKLTGKWIYNDGVYNLAYEFKSNGEAEYHEIAASINPYTYTYINIDISIKGIYTVTDNSVSVHYQFINPADMELSYRFDGDTLYINDIPFIREGSATTDSAAN